MAISDQTNRISQLRADHQNSITNLKKSYEAQLDKTNERNNLLMDDLRKSHNDNKESMLKENRDRIEIISNKANKLIDERRESYKSDLATEKEEFRNDRLKLSQDFQNKLSNLKNSYGESLKQYKNTHDDILKSKTENYENGLSNRDKQSAKTIAEIRSNSNETVGKLRDELSRQKRDLVQTNYNESLKEREAHKNELNKTKNDLRIKIDSIVENRDREMKKASENHLANSNRQKFERDEEIESLRNKFEDSVDKMNKDSRREMQGLQEGFAREKSHLLKDHQQDIYVLNREKDFLGQESKRESGMDFQKQEIRDSYQTRLDGMRDLMFDQREKFENDLSEMKRHVNAHSKEKSLNEREKLEKYKNEFNNNLNENIEKTRREQAQLEKDYNRKFRNQNEIAEADGLRKDNFYKGLLDKQRKHFGENVRRLEETNLDNVKSLQHEYALEKKEISDIRRKETESTIKLQREEFNRRVDKIVESYEMKFKKLSSELERTKDQAEISLAKYERNSKLKLSAESKFYNEMTKSQRSEMEDRLSDIRKDYDRKYKEAKFKFDTEVDKIRRENDVNHTKTIQKYEEEKQVMIASHQQELKTKLNMAESKLQRVLKDATYQKEKLITNYERQIKDLKRSYELEKVRDYKA